MKACALLVVLLVSTFAGPTACRRKQIPAKPGSLLKAYDVETDWSDPQGLIPGKGLRGRRAGHSCFGHARVAE